MKLKCIFSSMLMLTVVSATQAFAGAKQESVPALSPKSDSLTVVSDGHQVNEKKSRLVIGGYGEAVMTRTFYTDSWQRYTHADLYKDDKGYGRFDLPHVVIFLGYDFGRGWSMGTEIEFEHGGTESAIEIEEEETGEYESEIERGGEVALEQFWIQKSWKPSLNLRMGHVVVPVGLTNSQHNPTEFFGTFRPEGESTIIPCTWHETGISFWGMAKGWRYEIQFLAGLDADRFNNKNWVKGGAGSPYEFKIANSYATAMRVDNYSVKGLRIGLSGYVGNSAHNTLKRKSYKDLNGTVGIGALDFNYDDHNVIARGSFLYGHLTNSAAIAETNRRLKGFGITSPTNIGSDAMAAGVEVGYDFFSLNDKLRSNNQKFYLFARYDYYDSMFRMGKTDKGQQLVDEQQWGRHKVSVGINYKPMDCIVIKAEYTHRLFKPQFNDEPAVSIGIAYSGLFKK